MKPEKQGRAVIGSQGSASAKPKIKPEDILTLEKKKLNSIYSDVKHDPVDLS